MMCFKPIAAFGLLALALTSVAAAETIKVPKAAVGSEGVTIVVPAPRVVAGVGAESWFLVLSQYAKGGERLDVRVVDDASDIACEGGDLHLDPQPPGVRSLRLHRFTSDPANKLFGKSNGKLGPDQIGCGALGFTAITEHKHEAFTVLRVRQGGPAARAGLRSGDLVVAIDGMALRPSSLAPGWKWFEGSHEARLGRAIERSLSKDEPQVQLSVLRADGSSVEATLDVPFAGPLGDGFPLRGTHADALHADLVRWAVTHQKKNGNWPGTKAVNPALGALALLGTKDPQHDAAIKRTVEFLLALNPRPSEMKGLAYWSVAFHGMLFCEYHLRTGDQSVLPWIREAVTWLPTTTHECKWGMQAFGHGPSGLPYGEKALMAPTAHLLVFDALARRCGVESRIYEHVEAYVRHSWSNPDDGGHGAMGYNAASRDKGQFWSRTGLVALAEVLRGGEDDLAQTLCILMEERHPWMLNSHAYGEPGAALGLLALSVVKPSAFAEILPQWRWRFLCAWEPGYGLRYSTPHMGAPYMGQESVLNLAYLLLFATTNDGLAMATAPLADVAPKEVQRLATGMGFVEGPVWLPKEAALVFSDIPGKKLMRWSEPDGLTTFADVEHPNGNALDVDGALLTCSHGDRCIGRWDGGTFEPFVQSFEGKRLNSPNDLAVQSDGVIWFTDPPWGLERQREGRELPGNWVFRFDRASGDLRVVLRDRAMPNGIALSPDEKRLYVADTGAHSSHPDHAFARTAPTLSAYALEGGELVAPEPLWSVETVCDGMCVDSRGRVYATGREAVTVWSPEGVLLEEIAMPERPSNVCVGGVDGRTLFVTARTSLYAFRL